MIENWITITYLYLSGYGLVIFNDYTRNKSRFFWGLFWPIYAPVSMLMYFFRAGQGFRRHQRGNNIRTRMDQHLKDMSQIADFARQLDEKNSSLDDGPKTVTNQSGLPESITQPIITEEVRQRARQARRNSNLRSRSRVRKRQG